MSTAAQKLVQLSGLATGTAAQHLIAISQSGATAGQRLVSRSIFASATAGVHLNEGVVLSVTGSLAGTDQPDSLAAIGGVAVTGAWTVTEVGDDSLAAIGRTIASATFSAAEVGADQLFGAGSVRIIGLLSTTDGPDTMSATGTVEWAVFTGTLAAQEQNDLFGSAGQVLIAGPFAALEEQDTGSYAGTVLIQGAANTQELPDSGDVIAADVDAVVSGGLAVAEPIGDDSFFAIDLLRFGYWNKIKSEVVTRRIKLDVSTVEIDLNPVAQQIKLNPYAAVISANVAAVQARMDVQAQLLALTYKIGVFLKFAFFDEKAQLSDAITGFDIGKGASDAVSTIDRLLFGLNRPLQDGFVAFSQHAAHLGKQLGEDAFQTIDSEVLSVVKGLNDVPAARDALRADIYKALADAAKVLDSISRGSGKALTDAAAASDTRSSSVTKALADAARSSDAANRSTVKQLFDAARAIEAITVGLFKAAADGARASDAANRGVGKPLLDSTTALDSALKSFTRPLLDGARALDAITVIRGKNFFDVVGATDDFDGALSLEDDQEMVFSKSVSDSAFIISTFNRQIGYNRTYGDSAQVTDIVTNTSGKGHFDVAGVGSSGTLRSQSYCEASYFAEDYVGDSRNFS